jgi:hypothetical protein
MDVKALESTIARIPGVENVRIVVENKRPREVHVLATPGKPAKQLVRDVQSVAMAAFDLDIDRRIISVVQIDGGDLSAGDRPVVDDVAEEIDGSRMKITVTLHWHDEKLTGSAQGPAASTTRMRLVRKRHSMPWSRHSTRTPPSPSAPKRSTGSAPRMSPSPRSCSSSADGNE